MAGPLLRSLWSNTTRRSFSSPSSYLKSGLSLSSLRTFSAATASTAPDGAPNSSLDPNRLRNVAVIAHVDHGKTTLMDRILRQCGADIPHERAMDSINLERERGITISSKVTSVFWKDNELNMVDTPGHADFGGEVERVVGMVEGAILVVDVGEGPLAQTKFVLAKALKYGLRPILLLNEVDRPSVSEERCDEVESLVFDLFANLGATEEQLDFPVLYASAKEGWASSTFTKEPPADAKNMSQLLDAVVKYVPPPKANLDEPFLMLVSMMEKDFYLGRILTGRVSSGVVRVGDKINGLRPTDSGTEKIEEAKVVKLMKKKGTTIVSIDAAGAGDIICMAGLTAPSIGHTVASVEVTTALPAVELDPPTISMTFGVNDSPLAGRDGTQNKIEGQSFLQRNAAFGNKRARQSWFLSQHCHSTFSATIRTQRGSITEKPESVSPEWPKPTEIPYQPKIANSTDLIGYVNQPVEFHAKPDGSFWAGTVITHGPPSGSRIPVIFEGDLAQTANCHLKKNDRVHITGQIFVDASEIAGAKPDQAYVQVMVRDLHYIKGSKNLPKVLPPLDQQESVLKHSASILNKRDFRTDVWFDLVDKPDEWCDYRESKQNGLVNPRHPDFKKKDETQALWLNKAPNEILSDLKDLKFDVPVRSKYAKQPKAGEESWKDLVENMNNWWDNRLDKMNVEK